jgi:hypothetical protein
MIKPFKFLQLIKIPRTEGGIVKLKDIHNRDKYLLCQWSEYPLDGYEIYNNIRTFRGNILEFYNMIEAMSVSPTIYEIYKQRRGWFSTSIVFSNRHRDNVFISRKFDLSITYSLS